MAFDYDALTREEQLAFDRVREESFRSGYLQGYTRAYRDAEKMRKRGIRRLEEAANVLGSFSCTKLLAWRYEPCDEELPPPKNDIPAWETLRRKVLERDSRTCQVCGSKDNPEVDHIKQVCRGGFATEDNLRVLCRTCNRARPRR